MLVLSPMFVVYVLVYCLMMALITLVFLAEVGYFTAAYPFIRLANKLLPNFVLNEYRAVVGETYQKYIRARERINSLL